MVTFLQEFSAKIGHLWCRIGPIFVNSYKVLVYDKVMITVDDALMFFNSVYSKIYEYQRSYVATKTEQREYRI